MLDHDEKQEILAELGHYAQRQAAAPEALKIVARHHRWVSDEHLREVAQLLEMTPDEVDAVATFYNLVFRRPVGKHVILVCDSVSCWVLGYDRILDHLKTRLDIGLGETTADDRFTLLPSVCLGACDHAPVMMIDDHLYGNLTPAKIDEILARYTKEMAS